MIGTFNICIALILAIISTALDANAKQCDNSKYYIECLNSGEYDQHYFNSSAADLINKDHQKALSYRIDSSEANQQLDRLNKIHAEVQSLIKENGEGMSTDLMSVFVNIIPKGCFDEYMHKNKYSYPPVNPRTGEIKWSADDHVDFAVIFFTCASLNILEVSNKFLIHSDNKKIDINYEISKIKNQIEEKKMNIIYPILQYKLDGIISAISRGISCTQSMYRYQRNIQNRIIITNNKEILRPSSGYSGHIFVPLSYVQKSSDEELFLVLLHEELHAYFNIEPGYYCMKAPIYEVISTLIKYGVITKKDIPSNMMFIFNKDEYDNVYINSLGNFMALNKTDMNVDTALIWLVRNDQSKFEKYLDIINTGYNYSSYNTYIKTRLMAIELFRKLYKAGGNPQIISEYEIAIAQNANIRDTLQKQLASNNLGQNIIGFMFLLNIIKEIDGPNRYIIEELIGNNNCSPLDIDDYTFSSIFSLERFRIHTLTYTLSDRKYNRLPLPEEYIDREAHEVIASKIKEQKQNCADLRHVYYSIKELFLKSKETQR